MRDLAQLFSALADPTRLEMLALLLRHGELCVCDFVETLNVTQSKASRHLRYLWHTGLLADRRQGTWIYYRLADNLSTEVSALLDALRGVLQGRDLRATEKCLQRWLSQKNKNQRCCSNKPNTKRTRAIVEALK